MGYGDILGKNLKITAASHNKLCNPFQFQHSISVDGVHMYSYRTTIE